MQKVFLVYYTSSICVCAGLLIALKRQRECVSLTLQSSLVSNNVRAPLTTMASVGDFQLNQLSPAEQPEFYQTGTKERVIGENVTDNASFARIMCIE